MLISSLWQDARYGLRSLRRYPGFAAVAVLSLALGIGLNAAIFTLVDTVLFKPMPVERPDTLAAVFTSSDDGEALGTTSYLDFLDMKRQNSSFSDMVGRAMMFTSVNISGQNRLAMGEVVTANYFSTLGIRLALGRGFTPDEETGEGAHPVVVLSDALWRQAYAGSRDAIGRTLLVKNRPYTIVGIAAPGFTGLTPGISTQMWVPISMVADVEPVGQTDVVPSATGTTRLERRGTRWLVTLGRLRPGATPQTAEANLSGIMTRLESDYPMSNRNRKPRVLPASASRIHPMVDAALRPTGALLMGAVGLVLLVACANLASMLLARGVARAREMALRSALGASRLRVARQLIVENVMLATAGGALGLGLASAGMRLLATFEAPVEVPISLAFSLDIRVILFTAALSLLTGLAFGLLPALRASRADLIPALKSEASLSASPGRRFGLGQLLVVGQVAVSLVLIVGGLLLSRSLLASKQLDLGFQPEGVGMATIGLDFSGYSAERGRQFYDLAQQRIARLPGVESVALTERMPLSNNVQTTQIVIDGHPEMTPATGASIDATQVSAAYFQTLGLRIVEGRGFDDRDSLESPRVAVVSQAFAKRFWPDGTAVGKRFRLREQAGPAVDIVGVVPDYKIRTVGEAPRPVIHFARSQHYQAYATILARTRGDVGELVVGMQRELYGLEPSLVVMDSGPFEKLVAMSLFPVRAGAMLIGSLASLAMLLAGVGLYGVMAFGVSRRTREIGIRMALGADRTLVARQVMGQGLLLVGAGGVVGVVLAALGAQTLRAALNGVTPLDPVSYAGALAVLVVAAAAACYVPARRAASVDPLRALRQL